MVCETLAAGLTTGVVTACPKSGAESAKSSGTAARRVGVFTGAGCTPPRGEAQAFRMGGCGGESNGPPDSPARYGLIVTVRMTWGVSGVLISPDGPITTGAAAIASTTSIPFVTFPKMTYIGGRG